MTVSETSKLVFGGVFGFNAVLTYHMIDSEPSPEMQTALDELVSAGLIIRETGLPDMTRNAVRYRVAELNSKFQIECRKLMWDATQAGKAPSVRVSVNKDRKNNADN